MMLRTIFDEIKYSRWRDMLLPDNSSKNVDHYRRFIFVHNPKCAGTTIKKIFGPWFPGDHRVPTVLVSPKIWERYFSFVVIRNPFERLVSSFSYHTASDYKGFYFAKYPFLHSLSLEAYFDLMSAETDALRPNIDFVSHKLSDKPIDFICRFENLEQDIIKVLYRLNIAVDTVPQENKSKHKAYVEYFADNPRLLEKCRLYYKDDLDAFGYEF
ncbi:MAG: sulfotransferase family protein [Moorea sp. SIOASIH]|uniref:sulfotransferase family 2 domain-containing protein n=1 Tax=Moorena sp. SIOASIH TaxID=2607817 RepID=UPI0013B77216|nr:sulfotransferase family 2 domain-containing protein [Moorena sp. SIOASIH]NEO40886.1 sulfotransferase family protein [Moorena sp. SIOASIH]